MKTDKHQDKPVHVQSRKEFYDWLAQTIAIDGIVEVERDTGFDDIPKYRSAGIKLNYKTVVEATEGLREGVLLEVGFDAGCAEYAKGHQLMALRPGCCKQGRRHRQPSQGGALL